jgi:S1-C subfamily serine protease
MSSPILPQISDALAAAVQSAGPSVLRIEARRRIPASGIAWSADGLVATAHHVVERDDELFVGLPDGSRLPAILVGRDPTTDLALLRVDAALEPAAWASGDDLAVGHLALALGRPGRTVQATMGIVSAVGGAWRTAAGGHVTQYLATDVVMYPGFSGGPLIDAAGHVMGLTTSALARGTSLALPAETVRRVADELLAHGHVRRGYLGVGVQVVRLPEEVATDVGRKTGLLVVSVEPGGPAAAAGLSLGDTLLAVDGAPVRQVDDLLDALGGEVVGRSVPLELLRAGERVERLVTVAVRP